MKNWLWLLLILIVCSSADLAWAGRKNINNACYECYKRHRKCDGNRPCAECKEKKRECVDNARKSTIVPQLIEVTNVNRVCIECYKVHHRCDGTRPCDRCETKGLECQNRVTTVFKRLPQKQVKTAVIKQSKDVSKRARKCRACVACYKLHKKCEGQPCNYCKTKNKECLSREEQQPVVKRFKSDIDQTVGDNDNEQAPEASVIEVCVVEQCTLGNEQVDNSNAHCANSCFQAQEELFHFEVDDVQTNLETNVNCEGAENLHEIEVEPLILNFNVTENSIQLGNETNDLNNQNGVDEENHILHGNNIEELDSSDLMSDWKDNL